MSADLSATEQNAPNRDNLAAQPRQPAGSQEADASSEEEDEEDEEDRLKYFKLTGSLGNVYRNGDSTSAFTVAGDKMVLGTHNGNIHVLILPSLQSLKTYHAHSATITNVSVSPIPSPPSAPSSGTKDVASGSTLRPAQQPPTSSPRTPRPQQAAIPNTASNALHIATSSLDGHICISSLLDPKDIQLRNFARPVQSVALSPDYRNDRTYLSGGLAGQLILTIGGKAGVTVDANTNSSAAAASAGFLSAFGMGGDRGSDRVLHEGEGAISTIRWSLSGKWVVWVNEEGAKIMRSHLKLGSEDSEDAWRRIAHVARPNKRKWEEMVGVWRGKAEWVDDRKLETDERDKVEDVNGVTSEKKKTKSKVEKLVIGWGDTAWILHVTEGSPSPSSHITAAVAPPKHKIVGTADILKKIVFTDCIISGLALYTPRLLAVLAYRTTDDNGDPIHQTPKKGRRKQTALLPQLRLIDVNTSEEEEIDELPIARFDTLSAQDYHFGTLFIPAPSSRPGIGEKGALEGLWDSTRSATRMFSSAASVMSSRSGEEVSTTTNGARGGSLRSPDSSVVGAPLPPATKKPVTEAHPSAASPGLKLWILSPYDCVLAVKTDLGDHLKFLLKAERFGEAWEVVDKHPELVDSSSTVTSGDEQRDGVASPSSAEKKDGSLADFFADGTASGHTSHSSPASREKRRIADLWLQKLVSASHWNEAGRVAGKVLGTGRKGWEHWVLTFAHAGKFDEITPYIPADAGLPGLVYEVVLGHYVVADPGRVRSLLEVWEAEGGLFDVGTVRAAVERRLEGEDEVKDGSEDWRILTEVLAKLDLADGRAQEALRCYIRAQNAEKAFQLLREEKLSEVIAPEDVPGLLMLKVSKEQMRSAPLGELQEASREAVELLVQEAQGGRLMPIVVIRTLEEKGRAFRPFLYFYFRALWFGGGSKEEEARPRAVRRKFDGRIDEGHALVEDHADLAVELFAEYDRDLLLTFLRASELYSYEKATAICEQRHFIPELVYVLSKTGQTKRALFLIIGELGDVSQAVSLAKDNPDLWNDLLDYSMDKPSFIRGLLQEVGTAIDPIQLVRRIPEGLEIEGLKGGIARLMREYDIHFSILEGVARVLRGEVMSGMDTLRAGQRRGVGFEVLRGEGREVEVGGGASAARVEKKVEKGEGKVVESGRCVGCGELCSEDEKEILIGFACGHVYHLSCLLKSNPETSDPEILARLQGQLGNGGRAEEGYTGRSVGAKVAHAHIIKNIVQGGCRHCVAPDGV